MFATIHKNLHRKEIAASVSKSAFHRWLNGGSPHLKNLSACDAILGTNITIEYARKFTSVALQLSQTSEADKITMILAKSYLNDGDKKLLGDHHKKRIWRDISLVRDGELDD